MNVGNPERAPAAWVPLGPLPPIPPQEKRVRGGKKKKERRKE